MDNKKFAQDAFAQAHRATIERETDAFQAAVDDRGDWTRKMLYKFVQE